MTASDYVAWATGNDARIAELVIERDAIMARVLNGGKAVNNLLSGSSRGKSFTAVETIAATEKLAALNEALRILEVIPTSTRRVMTYGAFSHLER